MEVKCSFCNGEIYGVESFGVSFNESNIVEHYSGECAKCHAIFTWDEVYEFSRCENMTCVEEGEV